MPITAVKAPTNEWGLHSIVGGTWEWGNTSGSPNVGLWSHLQNRGPGPSNNPIRRLAGGIPWRDNSTNYRFIRRYDGVVSTIVNFGHYKSYVPPGHDQNGLNLINCVDGYFNVLSSVDDWSLENEAKVKALTRLGDRKVGWGSSIAELDKSFHHLCRTASDLLRAFRAAKRGQWNSVMKILGMSRDKVLWGRFPANRWLEYQYGWKPLMSTAHDVYTTIQSQSQKELLVYGKGTAKRAMDRSFEWTDWDGLTFEKRETVAQEYRCKVWGSVFSEDIRRLHELDLINPLQIAWELVPFSFVFDWFVPIGNCIEAMTASAGFNFIGGTWGASTGGVITQKVIRSSSGFIQRAGTSRCRLYGTFRIPLYDWPRPLPYIDNTPFSTPRALSALALWRGSFRG